MYTGTKVHAGANYAPGFRDRMRQIYKRELSGQSPSEDGGGGGRVMGRYLVILPPGPLRNSRTHFPAE
jgi:hypothetical protein